MSALFSAEYAPTGKRGLYGMFTPLGGDAGLVLASLTFLAVNYTIGEHSLAFMQWGWRLPFLIRRIIDRIAGARRMRQCQTRRALALFAANPPVPHPNRSNLAAAIVSSTLQSGSY